jgi:hypothetical protein
MAVVIVRDSAAVSDGTGGIVTLHRGDAWDSEHPVVKLHPDCFTDQVPPERRGTRNIEQATAAPGERRGRG